jgi:hypothetical protein
MVNDMIPDQLKREGEKRQANQAGKNETDEGTTRFK